MRDGDDVIVNGVRITENDLRREVEEVEREWSGSVLSASNWAGKRDAAWSRLIRKAMRRG